MYIMEINIFGFKFRLEILILIVVVYLILCGHLFCSCCKMNLWSPWREGFTGANTNNGQSSPYELGNPPHVDASKWGQQNLVITPGQPISPEVQKFLDRPTQKLPMPEGELDFLANVPFKPDCCPNAFSSSMGCACLSPTEYNYLITRAGNNIPYSEY